MGGFTPINLDHKDAEPNEQNSMGLPLTTSSKIQIFFEILEITVTEIEDRLKGDILWKMIAIIQTSWFIIHCIAHGQQWLALTELELVTLLPV